MRNELSAIYHVNVTEYPFTVVCLSARGKTLAQLSFHVLKGKYAADEYAANLSYMKFPGMARVEVHNSATGEIISAFDAR